ncbi:MAG: sigma-70 family RNA polymerase sigma factor [Anaerococcus sp.]|nr:sigma-70 family RNA polymerase sigma factor [Peptoniphilaceae bacterium]MDY3055854.1 sigma-70 family RNA polymerase sigma factor [Anaerococcus sp.]
MEINIKNSSKILEKYRPLLLKTVSSFPVFEKDEALDEAREVLIDAIEKYDKTKAGFGGYLKYRLYYHFLDKTKKPRYLSLNEKTLAGEEIQDSLEADIDIEKDFLDQETYDELYKAIQVLDDKEKILIHMRYFEDKSYQEIGKVFNLSPKTIRNNHYKIISKLRKELIN